MHTYICIYMYVHIPMFHIYIYTYIHMYVYVYVRVCAPAMSFLSRGGSPRFHVDVCRIDCCSRGEAVLAAKGSCHLPRLYSFSPLLCRRIEFVFVVVTAGQAKLPLSEQPLTEKRIRTFTK